MRFGLYLRSFLSDPTRALHEQIDEVIEICHVARDSGFASVTVPQHWVSHPTVWPQPFPLLARLAPETGDMRLMTGILLLPLHNPLQIAEDAATLDHISKGRLTLGVGIGYRDTELEAAGTTRKHRASRIAESVELMKLLWTGEEVSFEGRYWSVHEGRMGFRPYQDPHPPIWMAGQSEGAVKRAARIADSCYLGPQVGFDDLRTLLALYHAQREEAGRARGGVAISRGVSLASSREAAVAEAQASAASSYKMYAAWNMQEHTMVKINISAESEVGDWAVTGSAADCVEQYARLEEELGVDSVVNTCLNLPKGLEARKEYVQRFGETVIQAMKQPA